MKNDKATTQRIAALNDAFRHSFSGGDVILTDGVRRLDAHVCAELYQKIRLHMLEPENDPYGEHDLGSIVHAVRPISGKSTASI